MGWQSDRGFPPGEPPGRHSLPGAPSAFAHDGPWADAPPSAALAAALEELAGPDDQYEGAGTDAQVGAARQWDAIESYAAARKLGALRSMMREDCEGEPALRRRADLPAGWDDSLNYEVAGALAMGPVSAGNLAALAWALGTRLPGIGALLTAGTLTLAKARLVVQVFEPLSDAEAAQAEALLLPELEGKKYFQVERLAWRAAVTVAPDVAERRRAGAEQTRARVTIFREEAGTVGLSGRDLPASGALSGHANVLARANAYEASGAFPGRSGSSLQALAYLDLLNGVSAQDRVAFARADAADPPPDAGQPDDDQPPDDDPGAGSPGRPDEPGPDDSSPASPGPGDSGPTAPGPVDPGSGDLGPTGPGPDGRGPAGVPCPEDHGPGDGFPGSDNPGEPDSEDPGNSDPGPGPREQDSGGERGAHPSSQEGGGNRPGDALDDADHADVSGASAAGAPPGGLARGAGQAALPEIAVPLATLLRQAERPGDSRLLGALDPALARELTAAAALSPASRWEVTIVDDHGYAVGHGIARDRSGQPKVQPRGPSPGLSLRVNITVTAAHLRRLADGQPRPGTLPAAPHWPGAPPGGWQLTRTGPTDDGCGGWADGYGTWALTVPGGRQLAVRFDVVPTHACDHRHQTTAYQPTARLRRLVQVRDHECTFPTCTRPARESDFEHALPYDQGGRTDACNAGARSRRCHQVKQLPGWTVTQPKPGWHTWTTPTGRSYTQEPWRYPA